MSKNSGLSAKQRIDAALNLHLTEFPGTQVSITKLCRMASVSRASLYEHHRDLVEEIRKMGTLVEKKRKATPITVSDLKQQLAKEKKRTAALHYLCVELLSKVQRLEKNIALNIEYSDNVGAKRSRRPT